MLELEYCPTCKEARPWRWDQPFCPVCKTRLIDHDREHDDREPEPPTEEEVAKFRQDHYGEGVPYDVLKGRR